MFFKKITKHIEVPIQLTHSLKLYTWAPIGLATQGALANPIGTSSLSLRGDANWSDASS